jgi:predicted AAA+ superfamily ATPase
MFERIELQQLTKVIQEPRKFIQVVVGPRQVGKTTLVTQLIQKHRGPSLFVAADSQGNANSVWLQQQWEIARTQLKQNGGSDFLLVIDEIQKIAQWSEVVKGLWDNDTQNQVNIKLIILGSSKLLLQNGLTESLAGRFEVIQMTHWSYNEMHKAFGWKMNEYIWFGGYPGSASLINDEKRWKNYIVHSLIETSISKDILMITRIDKPALMKQLFEVGCLYSGQILSYTKMLGQLQDAGNTTTLAHYLKLLHTAGLLGGIEKYANDIIRKRLSSPKFQVHNTAFISAQQSKNRNEIKQNPSEWGRIAESAVGAHLLNMAIKENYSLYYWRERNVEVDFVIEYKNKLMAIEVKTGMIKAHAGLASFQQQYNPAKLLLVGNGGLPIEEFLQMNPIDLF